MQEQPDLPAITAVAHDYLEGMYRRDLARLRRIFHPTACLFGHYDRVFARVPLEEWLKAVEGRPVPADTGQAFDMRIVSIDVTGQVATVKAHGLYRGLRFTDYLTLARVEGQWLIVNKTFHHD